MNKGRYLQIMDVARTGWMIQTGVLSALLRHRRPGVLGDAVTRYCFSLRPFQSYRASTKLVLWKERRFVYEHIFFDTKDRCVAAGLSRAAIRSRAVSGAGLVRLVRLVKDTFLDAFVLPDHASIQANEQVSDVFGLSDPMAIASTDRYSIFQPHPLQLRAGLTDAINALPNVRTDPVASLVSESVISGSDGALRVDPYIDEDGMGVAEALAAERLWRRMAPHVGTPISEDRAGAVILAEVIDTSRTAETCRAVQEITKHHQNSEVQVLVAGPAAVSGLLSYQIGKGR